MSKLTKALTAAAGNAGGDNLYVEDVFSTYLWAGNSTAGRVIVNDIDVSGEGGLVWIKDRTLGDSHSLFTTTQGANKTLLTNTTDAEDTVGTDVFQAFNSNGFTVGSHGRTNENNRDYASWTFRKAEKFFDVVTWTGDGSNTRRIPHNINGSLGFIVVKKTSASQDWVCAHSYDSFNNNFKLNTTGTTFGAGYIDTPNETSFGVNAYGNPTDLNTSGQTYVAYLFASDAGGFGDDGDSIIKCGKYTGNGSTTGPIINLGFEPQWVMIKNITFANDWWIFDSMRGITSEGADSSLRANISGSENTGTNALKVTATGFQLENGGGDYNGSTQQYIYIAIRRPMKTPESGTEVFAIGQGDGDADVPDYISNFPVDAAITKRTSAGNNGRMSSRLTGANYLSPNLTQAESADGAATFDFMNGWGSDGANRNTDEYAWMFKRATGFFDVVAYTGDGTPSNTVRRDLKHNLGVAPELAILKRRDSTSEWQVAADGKELYLNLNLASQGTYTPSSYFNATDFDVEGWINEANNNVSGSTYIAYLFATLAGVSKVGSYTGTGSNVDVDCGFSAGARFILIKRTDATGDWYVYDSVRGIVAGNDPYLLLNSTAAEVTSTDYIDPLSSGFTVTSSAPAALNASGGTYIFMAIS